MKPINDGNKEIITCTKVDMMQNWHIRYMYSLMDRRKKMWSFHGLTPDRPPTYLGCSVPS